MWRRVLGIGLCLTSFDRDVRGWLLVMNVRATAQDSLAKTCFTGMTLAAIASICIAVWSSPEKSVPKSNALLSGIMVVVVRLVTGLMWGDSV